MAYYSDSSDYEVGLPLAGKLVSKTITAAADTYYIGMPLTYNDTNDNYEYGATGIVGIVIEETTLSAEGQLLCAITGTEFLESALVDGDNATLTITDDQRNTALGNGIVLR